MMLVFVVLMEYKERGIIFRWPTADNTLTCSKKLRFSLEPSNLVRRYHGYAFAWATCYTFWYHPMENTMGHVMGFIYTYMILLQGEDPMIKHIIYWYECSLSKMLNSGYTEAGQPSIVIIDQIMHWWFIQVPWCTLISTWTSTGECYKRCGLLCMEVWWHTKQVDQTWMEPDFGPCLSLVLDSVLPWLRLVWMMTVSCNDIVALC